jgi:YidC/Oxa1 family membrane protein insertase
MIDAVAQFFGVVISFIYDYVPNLGLSIIIMTVLVKLVTFPLNNKQIQSAKRMQQLQPEMKKIQAKYKDDKEKQNQAVTEFMRENNMNPLAGCLPLLVQFPILIGIFRLLREANEFLDMSMINPYLFPSAKFIDLLAVPNIGFDNFLSEISIYYIFPLIAGATTYLYSKMSMSGDSNQKMLLYMMPVMITVFSFSFPVGLVIYWIMNNVFSIGQHKFIVSMDSRNAAIKDDKKLTAASEKNEEKPETDELENKNKLDTRPSKNKSKKGKGKK